MPEEKQRGCHNFSSLYFKTHNNVQISTKSEEKKNPRVQVRFNKHGESNSNLFCQVFLQHIICIQSCYYVIILRCSVLNSKSVRILFRKISCLISQYIKKWRDKRCPHCMEPLEKNNMLSLSETVMKWSTLPFFPHVSTGREGICMHYYVDTWKLLSPFSLVLTLF